MSFFFFVKNGHKSFFKELRVWSNPKLVYEEQQETLASVMVTGQTYFLVHK